MSWKIQEEIENDVLFVLWKYWKEYPNNCWRKEKKKTWKQENMKTFWLNRPEDEHLNSTNPEGGPSSAIPVTKELKLTSPCTHYNTNYFSKGLWFISSSFSYGEDLYIYWTLLTLFWILLQTHLLMYCKWTFSFPHKLIFFYECILCL